MAIIKFTVSVEDVDDTNFNISDREAQHLLNELEDLLAKQGYTIHNQEWEREE